jgi:hypothetical protein
MTDQGSAAPTGGHVVLFDFYSHAHMHLPFNEGYLRIVRTAFPQAPITLHADPEHLANLTPRIAGLDVRCRPLARVKVPFGLSRHNPVGARLAAATRLRALRRRLQDSKLLVGLLGVDAGLYAAVAGGWRSADGPVHMLMHGSLAANYVWRSRNPFIRLGDFRTALQRPLRPGVTLMGLELGVTDAIAADFPATTPSLGVLEHPVLAREWSESGGSRTAGLAVGFLGYGSARKGFDVFAKLARDAANPALVFDAVGHGQDVPGLDTSALRRQLAVHSLSREEYLAGLRTLDLVCLPLHGRSYEFAASGTVSDAVAALKPILAFRNRTLQAIQDRYGPIGRLFETVAEMTDYLRTLDRAGFERDSPAWVSNLRCMRQARLPEALGLSYRV